MVLARTIFIQFRKRHQVGAQLNEDSLAKVFLWQIWSMASQLSITEKHSERPFSVWILKNRTCRISVLLIFFFFFELFISRPVRVRCTLVYSESSLYGLIHHVPNLLVLSFPALIINRAYLSIYILLSLSYCVSSKSQLSIQSKRLWRNDQPIVSSSPQNPKGDQTATLHHPAQQS